MICGKLKVKSTIWFKEGSSGVDDPFFSMVFFLYFCIEIIKDERRIRRKNHGNWSDTQKTSLRNVRN